MMNITPQTTLVRGQSAHWLIVTRNALDSRSRLKLWTHRGDPKDIAEIHTTGLDDALGRLQRQVAVDIHNGIQQPWQSPSLLRPRFQQSIDLTQINLRLQIVLHGHRDTGSDWLIQVVNCILGDARLIKASLGRTSCGGKFAWRELFSSLANIGLKPWSLFPLIQRLIVDGNRTRRT